MKEPVNRAYEAILLLGTELDAQDLPTDELRGRVKAAADAYAQGLSGRIVACGGVLPGHAVSEAEIMADMLKACGVPESAITLERQSQDTMENMRFAAQALGNAGGRRVLIVTSDYHLRRAVLTAKRIGFRAKGIPALMEHDALWAKKKRQELLFTLDLMAGWQDEGKCRPAWTYRVFEMLFGKRS